VVLEGTPDKTYYYKIGENDYTQGDAQWLLADCVATDENMLTGANDENAVSMTTTDEETGVTKVNYGLKNNKFRRYTEDGWINYNKAYLSIPEQVAKAKELNFAFHNLDGTTKIVSAQQFKNAAEDGIIYDLQGQQVNDNHKGIVIKNGKKYLNK